MRLPLLAGLAESARGAQSTSAVARASPDLTGAAVAALQDAVEMESLGAPQQATSAEIAALVTHSRPAVALVVLEAASVRPSRHIHKAESACRPAQLEQ